MTSPKPYGALKFIGDCLMTLITGGLWFIWIFVREMRRPRSEDISLFIK